MLRLLGSIVHLLEKRFYRIKKVNGKQASYGDV
jgi:hypothetical protein